MITVGDVFCRFCFSCYVTTGVDGEADTVVMEVAEVMDAVADVVVDAAAVEATPYRFLTLYQYL